MRRGHGERGLSYESCLYYQIWSIKAAIISTNDHIKSRVRPPITNARRWVHRATRSHTSWSKPSVGRAVLKYVQVRTALTLYFHILILVILGVVVLGNTQYLAFQYYCWYYWVIPSNGDHPY